MFDDMDQRTVALSVVGVLAVGILVAAAYALLQTPFPANLVIGATAVAFLVGIATIPLGDTLMRHAVGGFRGKFWWIVGALNWGATVMIEHERGYDLVPATIDADGTWHYDWRGESHTSDGPTFRLGLRPFAITYRKDDETMADLVRSTEVDDERGGHETVRALAEPASGAAEPRLEADGGAHVTPIREMCEGYAVDLINVWHQMQRTGGLSVVERAKEAALRDKTGDKSLTPLQHGILLFVLFVVSWGLSYMSMAA